MEEAAIERTGDKDNREQRSSLEYHRVPTPMPKTRQREDKGQKVPPVPPTRVNRGETGGSVKEGEGLGARPRPTTKTSRRTTEVYLPGESSDEEVLGYDYDGRLPQEDEEEYIPPPMPPVRHLSPRSPPVTRRTRDPRYNQYTTREEELRFGPMDDIREAGELPHLTGEQRRIYSEMNRLGRKLDRETQELKEVDAGNGEFVTYAVADVRDSKRKLESFLDSHSSGDSGEPLISRRALQAAEELLDRCRIAVKEAYIGKQKNSVESAARIELRKVLPRIQFAPWDGEISTWGRFLKEVERIQGSYDD